MKTKIRYQKWSLNAAKSWWKFGPFGTWQYTNRFYLFFLWYQTSNRIQPKEPLKLRIGPVYNVFRNCFCFNYFLPQKHVTLFFDINRFCIFISSGYFFIRSLVYLFILSTKDKCFLFFRFYFYHFQVKKSCTHNTTNAFSPK